MSNGEDVTPLLKRPIQRQTGKIVVHSDVREEHPVGLPNLREQSEKTPLDLYVDELIAAHAKGNAA